MARFKDPFVTYVDNAGDPLIEGKLFFHKTGTNTDLDTFKDVNLSIPNSNPVDLTAAGRPPDIWLQSASYKVILTDKNGVQIREADPIGGQEGAGQFGSWNGITIYDTNSIVEGSDGCFYRSIVDGNQNKDPASSPERWEKLILGGVWNENITYIVGSVVISPAGFLYTSVTNGNLNNNPDTDFINWQTSSNLDIPPLVIAAANNYAYENF